MQHCKTGSLCEHGRLRLHTVQSQLETQEKATPVHYLSYGMLEMSHSCTLYEGAHSFFATIYHRACVEENLHEQAMSV